MISLSGQRDFIVGELRKLGEALDLDLAVRLPELEGNEDLKTGIEAKVAPVDFFRTKSWDSLLRLGLYRAIQYSVARSLPAAGVIETGVLHGLSTCFPLAALQANGGGKMISIDYPSTYEEGPSNIDGFTDTLPPGLDPGWAVPEPFRDHWTLLLGPSQEHLNAAISTLGEIDLFIHDSDHTVETMTYEFEAVWPALGSGGVLIADNIDVNTSFFDFARRIGRIPYVTPVDPDHFVPGASGIRCGIVRK